MPRQSFATADSPGTPLVSLTWVGDHREIEVASGSTVLTRISDPTPLRTTGLRGTDPQGVEIFVRLVDTGISEEFQVLRNNVSLIGSLVVNDSTPGTAAGPMAGTAPLGPMPDTSTGWPQGQSTGAPSASGSGTTLGAATTGVAASAAIRPEVDALQTRARKWLKGLGYLALFGGVLVLLLSMSDEVENQAGIRLAGIVTLVIGIVFVALGRLALGERARSMFGVGAGLTGLLALSNVATIASSGPRGLLSIVIPSLTCMHCVKAFRAS